MYDYQSEDYINITSKDKDECHQKCYFDSKCLAYSFFNRKCVLKYDKKSSTNCSKGSICHTIPGIEYLLII